MQSLVDLLIGWRKVWIIESRFQFRYDSLIVFCNFCLKFYVSGVYDALQNKYLKTLLFCVCEAVDGPMIEEYACEFSEFFLSH